MNQELADFLKKKKKKKKKKSKQGQLPASLFMDRDDRRDKYLAAVQDLYHQIETILAEPIRQETASLQRRPKQLTESYIGTYSVEDLVLVIGDEQVRFSPVGRNIAGAAGRVDVIGERGEASLIVQPDSRWGFMQTRQPTLRVVPFDESTLTEMLRIVMRD
jgi:hypothetical protein